MLAAFNMFLLLTVLNTNRSDNSPEPNIRTNIEFLGFFEADKFCYYQYSTIYPRAYDCNLDKIEFVVKDFLGREISRDVIKKEEITPDYDYKNFDKLIIKTEYPSTRNVIDFLRRNKITKNKSLYHSNIYIKDNNLYYKKEDIKKKDSTLILDSSQVRKLIIKYNKEPIYVEYIKTQWYQTIKLGSYEKNMIFDTVSNIYEWKNKYLLILDNNTIILLDKILIDNILKKE